MFISMTGFSRDAIDALKFGKEINLILFNGSAFQLVAERKVALPVDDLTADRLIAVLKPRVEALHVGPFTDAASDMGPVITQQSLDRITKMVDDGVAAGARLIVDGRRRNVERGFFIGGCLFDGVQPDMTIYREEIFGPVLSIVRPGSYDAAVRLVNEHEYGNGAVIFTRDGGIARDFFARVKIGMVGVNVPIPVPAAYHSFGGWKRSLFGDHHIHGMEGIRFNTRLKTLTARWPAAGLSEGAVFNFHAGSEAADRRTA